MQFFVFTVCGVGIDPAALPHAQPCGLDSFPSCSDIVTFALHLGAALAAVVRLDFRAQTGLKLRSSCLSLLMASWDYRCAPSRSLLTKSNDSS